MSKSIRVPKFKKMAKFPYVDTGVDVGSPAGTWVDLRIVVGSRLQSGA